MEYKIIDIKRYGGDFIVEIHSTFLEHMDMGMIYQEELALNLKHQIKT